MRTGFVAITAGLVVALAACSNPQNSRNSGSKASDSTPSVTLTGCLIQGSDASTFVLQNARPKDTDQTTGVPPTSTSYVLLAASNDVDLAKQLNHQVEIKGRSDNTLTETTPTPATRDQRAEAQPNQTIPRLLVNDVKSVNDRCTMPTP